MGRATRLGQAVARSAADMSNLVGNNSQVSLSSPFYAVISNPKEVNGPLNFPPLALFAMSLSPEARHWSMLSIGRVKDVIALIALLSPDLANPTKYT
jgi:hypothetical protein